MSAFVSMLGGFAKGAGDAFQEQQREKREYQRRQNELLADSIDTRINTDKNLSLQDLHDLHKQSLLLRGVPKGQVEQLAGIGLTGLAHQMRQREGMAPAGPAQGTGDFGGEAGPAQSAAPGALPPIPQAPSGTGAAPGVAGPVPQPFTTGDVEANRQAAVTQFNTGLQTQAKIAETKATQEAELKRQKDLLQAKYDQIRGFAGEQGSGRPVHMKLASNGDPVFDPGKFNGVTAGTDINEDSEYKGGPPIDKGAFYRGTRYELGGNEWQKIPGVKGSTTIVDPASVTGFSKVPVMINGAISQDKELWEPVAAPSAYVPQTISTNRTETRDINGQVTPVVLPSSTTRGPAIPITTTAPAGAPGVAPPVPSRPTPGQPKPKGVSIGPSLGNSSGRQARVDANPLTGDAQKIMESSSPVIKQIDRALAMLEPIKNENDPFHFAAQRLGYAIGKENEATTLISNLELGSIVGSARILAGSSRAYQALQQGKIHLPDPKKDSPKQMVDKLNNARQNLVDIQNDAQKYGQRFPGLNGVAGPVPNSGPKQITSEAEYNALPPGPYIDPNGVQRVKK